MSHPVDKKLVAVCGLFCRACHVYIATHEDPDKLAAMAQRYGRTVEELRCDGCRSSRRCFYCETMCFMAKCAAGKGVEFCGDCAEYPCAGLKKFQSLAPHRIELWKNHARRKEVGLEAWYTEMLGNYSCPDCGTINSAYDLKCRKCGRDPSCAYVGRNKGAIVRHMAKSK